MPKTPPKRPARKSRAFRMTDETFAAIVKLAQVNQCTHVEILERAITAYQRGDDLLDLVSQRLDTLTPSAGAGGAITPEVVNQLNDLQQQGRVLNDTIGAFGEALKQIVHLLTNRPQGTGGVGTPPELQPKMIPTPPSLTPKSVPRS